MTVLAKTRLGIVIGYRRIVIRLYWPWRSDFWRNPLSLTVLRPFR